MAANFTTFPGWEPCNGGASIVAQAYLEALIGESGVPSIVHLASSGSGSTVIGAVKAAYAYIPGTDDLSLTNSDQWNQTGKGYQATLTRHAVNYRIGTCSSDKYIPNLGFCCAALVKVPATISGGSGIFAKVDAAVVANQNTLTKGFGVMIDAGAANVVGWVDNLTQSVSVPIAALPTGEYAIVALRFDDNTRELTLSILSSAPDSATDTFTATTLGGGPTDYSDFFVGTLPGTTAAVRGGLAFGGQLVWTAMWDTGEQPADTIALLNDDPFAMSTWPTGRVFVGEDPQTLTVTTGAGAILRTRYACYIHNDYDKTQHFTIFDTPGTPQSDYTADEWLASTLGLDIAGTFPPGQDLAYVLTANGAQNGGPAWDAAMDDEDFPCAVVVTLSDLNGGFLGGGSSTNQSVCLRRQLSLRSYFNNVTRNPLSTANRDLMCWTGWSIGAVVNNFVFMWPEFFKYMVSMHSSFLQGVSPNTAFNAYGERRVDYTSPPVFNVGNTHRSGGVPPSDEIRDGTAPTLPELTEPNGHTVGWATNDDGKTVQALFITGTHPADGVDIATIDDDIDLMVAQGYSHANLRHKHYTTGRDALHSKGRDLIIRFLKYGFAPFFPADDGSNSVHSVFGWGDSVQFHPNPYY